MDMHTFLPYLPGRDEGPEATEAILTICNDVEGLLLQDEASFWEFVRSPSSGVMLFIESYIRYAPRPFDEGFHDLSAVELSLWQNSFSLLKKLCVACSTIS